MEIEIKAPPERSNTFKHAQHEFAILLKSATENNRPIVEPFIAPMLELIDAFGKSGQSGGSAPFTANAICESLFRALMHKPQCPITGIADEWVDVTVMNDGEILYQNNRLASVFKNLKGAYFLDAIVFVEQKGKGAAKNRFTSPGGVSLASGGVVTSNQFIAGFPFKPKTFYIDVKYVGDTAFVRDEKQLEAVWKYYKKQSQIIAG